MLLQQLVNGVMLGAVYALIAIGYTLIFGVLGMLHLAHGEVFMLGAFVGLVVVTVSSGNVMLALAAAMLATGLLGVLIERVAFRPLRGAHHLAPLATTIGAGIALQETARWYFGPEHGLAPRLVRQIFAVVAELKREGVTIVLVEQNARQALGVADRAYIIQTGQVVLAGPAAELAGEAVQRAYLGGPVRPG